MRADLESLRAYSVKFVTERGIVSIDVHTPEDVALARKYLSAVRNYLTTGNKSTLASFRGKRLESHYFVTETQILDMLADAGELDFDDTNLRRHLGHGLFDDD